MSRAAFLLVCCIALPQCGQSATKPITTEHASASIDSPAESVTDVTAVQLSKLDMASVCQATLAALNGHDPSIMRVTSNTGDLVQVRYARPSDGKVWINECQVEGDRVIWRTVDAFGAGSRVGRWRTVESVDEVITYKLDGRKVSITTSSPNGLISTQTYAMGQSS
jgi:hypothetical protein